MYSIHQSTASHGVTTDRKTRQSPTTTNPIVINMIILYDSNASTNGRRYAVPFSGLLGLLLFQFVCQSLRILSSNTICLLPLSERECIHSEGVDSDVGLLSIHSVNPDCYLVMLELLARNILRYYHGPFLVWNDFGCCVAGRVRLWGERLRSLDDGRWVVVYDLAVLAAVDQGCRDKAGNRKVCHSFHLLAPTVLLSLPQGEATPQLKLFQGYSSGQNKSRI